MAKRNFASKRKHTQDFETKNQGQDIPWVEDFSPHCIDDLAVHKKKISELQSWLASSLSCSGVSKETPILLLTGPPGVGKTATVKVLCRHLCAELFTWSNSLQQKASKNFNEGFDFNHENTFGENETQTLAFSRFLLHSSKYSLYGHQKRVILVEEFPNAFLKSPNDFHSIAKKFALYGKSPAVFILSDNTKGESLEHRLFPKDLQASLKITNISFNPVAPTMLMKALQRINNSSKVESVYTKLSKSQLEAISADCMGDIRNAINSMQFMCMTQTSEFKKPMPVTAVKSGTDKTIQKSSNCSVKRDTSLFLFHALGKILYCKRDASVKTSADVLPHNLKGYERDPLVSNPEEVYEKTSISAEGFSMFLQENYLDFVEDINVVAECSRWLSAADVINADWSGKDIMNDYMVSLAARGLMYNLVPNSSSKRWRPLHKPQFFENNLKKSRLTNSLRQTFRGFSLSTRELQIDFVPFISKIQSKDMNFAQSGLAAELGKMNVKRFFRPSSNNLDEKDFFNPGDDYDSNNVQAVDCVPDSEMHMQDEEIVIEEYDF